MPRKKRVQMPSANSVCIDFALMVAEWHGKLIDAGFAITAKKLKDAEKEIGWEAAARITRERKEDRNARV